MTTGRQGHPRGQVRSNFNGRPQIPKRKQTDPIPNDITITNSDNDNNDNNDNILLLLLIIIMILLLLLLLLLLLAQVGKAIDEAKFRDWMSDLLGNSEVPE